MIASFREIVYQNDTMAASCLQPTTEYFCAFSQFMHMSTFFCGIPARFPAPYPIIPDVKGKARKHLPLGPNKPAS